jgi:3',5'-cyclic AMP phosphodiesterase CpdA
MKKIAQITDLHLDDFLAKEFHIDARKNFETILSLAQSRGVSSAILTGDLGAPESAPWLFETLKAYGFDFQIVLGNHDILADFQRFDFLQPLIRDDGLYFSKTIENVECLFLDSSAHVLGDVQLDWIKQQLSQSQEPLSIFIHHPILDCGNTIADRLFPLKNREAVQQVLLESGREINIFCGHYHYIAAIEKQAGSLHQFLTPSAFGQIKQDGDEIQPAGSSYIAYREIWFTDKTLQTEVVGVN